MFFDVKMTVNPLVYRVKVSWVEAISGTLAFQVWNLLQRWLATNDCVPDGRVSPQPTSLTVLVVVKRRMGNPKDESP
jgi:hypothetical protein